MSKYVRQSQHRAEREGAKGRILAESKKQVKQLKKLVGRQQKQIRRLQDMLGLENTPEIEESDPATVADSGPFLGAAKPLCSNCKGADLVDLSTPTGKVTICKSCKHRWRASL